MGATAHYRALSSRLAQAASRDRDVAEACRSFRRPGQDPLSLLMAAMPEEFREKLQGMAEGRASLPLSPPSPGTIDPLGVFGEDAREAAAMFEESTRIAEATLSKHGLDPAELRDELDIDKSWRALEATLEALTPPGDRARDAVLGGAPLGEDLGYGPARWIDPAAVVALSSALAAVSEDAVRAHAVATTPPLPPELLAKLPTGFVFGGAEAQVEVFLRVRDYLVSAAARGDAMLLWLV